MTSEFSLINHFFKPLSQPLFNQQVGIGDDGAVLNCRNDCQLVVVTDTLIEGIHFPENTKAYDVAWKALAVNLSDLAAMGAMPAFYSLALSLPEHYNHEAWCQQFAEGLRQISDQFQIPLVGGDTTKHNSLVVTITAQGWVNHHQAILRSGAQPDDLIFVTGNLGNAGLGLKKLLQQQPVTSELESAINRPIPKVTLGTELIGLATAAIDISDGFLADLKHLLSASEAGAELDYQAMPFSQAVKAEITETGQWLAPLIAGDDYELCFTVPPMLKGAIEKLANQVGCPITEIGTIQKQAGIVMKHAPEAIDLNELKLGYLHF